jgi:hypothetical protein
MKPAGTEAEVAGNGEGITCFANIPVAATARANGPISYFFQTRTTTTTKKQFLPTRMNRFASPLDLPTSDGTNSYGLKKPGGKAYYLLVQFSPNKTLRSVLLWLPQEFTYTQNTCTTTGTCIKKMHFIQYNLVTTQIHEMLKKNSSL